MPTTTAPAPTTNSLTVDRKRLLTALDQVRAVVPARYSKPILTGVHLEASNGTLHLAATDGEVKLLTRIEAEGELLRCVAPCAALVQRLKASRENACMLTLRARSSRLLVNGGRVEHALPTLPADEFPPIPGHHEGSTLTLDAAELRSCLRAVACAVARETSRYAINGILLESDDDGVRLVATDGRRLAVADLAQHDGVFRGQVIIPARVAKLIEKFTAREDGPLVLAIKPNQNDKGEPLPADVYVAGTNWLLYTPEIEGRFPGYRDLTPQSQSRFAVDRRQLLETLKEIALATSEESRMVCVDLTPRRIQLSAESSEAGEATAKLTARFLGGGDRSIHTAFNPIYLLDALTSLDGKQVVIDIGQNGCGCDGKVFGKPALIYVNGDESVRWLIMPVHMGLAATRENLGSNYREEAA